MNTQSTLVNEMGRLCYFITVSLISDFAVGINPLLTGRLPASVPALICHSRAAAYRSDSERHSCFLTAHVTW